MKYLKNIGLVSISVILFFIIWNQGALYLFDVVVDKKIEKAG